MPCALHMSRQWSFVKTALKLACAVKVFASDIVHRNDDTPYISQGNKLLCWHTFSIHKNACLLGALLYAVAKCQGWCSILVALKHGNLYASST